MSKMLAEIKIVGRDELALYGTVGSDGKVTGLQIKSIGCWQLLKFIASWKQKLASVELTQVQVPQGDSHPEILVRELIRKAQGVWHPPYTDEELCHCRMVPTHLVIDAIRSGAKTNAEVSAMTSATTACGTCGPDVRALISYYRSTSMY